jgi:YgiT-type zinc finger domain-containing protein
MTCVICNTGRTQPGVTTVTLQRGNTVVVIKDVPAEICEDCGEYYLAEPEAQKVNALAEGATQRNAELEILHYAA